MVLGCECGRCVGVVPHVSVVDVLVWCCVCVVDEYIDVLVWCRGVSVVDVLVWCHV